MGYKGMRLLALFAAALVLLCGAQAVAERMTAVPADRIRDVALPAGVVMTRDPVIADGRLSSTSMTIGPTGRRCC